MWLVYPLLRCSSFSLHTAPDCCVGALQGLGETKCHLGNFVRSFLTNAALVCPRGVKGSEKEINNMETPYVIITLVIRFSSP